MNTYAIGDIQGCLDPLQRLLDLVAFDPAVDRLWFVGDLVNRGPDSLATLRFVRGLGSAAVTVLGNHDLHLLAIAEGFETLKRGDTLLGILEAPDRTQLLDWLRVQPLLHREHGFTLVHAGLLPQWSVEQAAALAREVEAVLRSRDYRDFLANMYGNRPARWDETLSGFDRLRVVVNAMTRLRACTAEGEMEFTHKSHPRDLPAPWLPWYAVPGRCSAVEPVLFGHWSSLGVLHDAHNVWCLDGGCLWGRCLTALRLDDRRLFHVDCAAAPRTPGRAQ
ncbi:MAG: symmetrical bis(5'-nucleosyl)-tetraphosphatase [Burkholderiales bacterium]|nr:symmetrical bis(5'-nucleosyl)-tetraphosphatase [Burkholderiales bacterium]